MLSQTEQCIMCSIGSHQWCAAGVDAKTHMRWACKCECQAAKTRKALAKGSGRARQVPRQFGLNGEEK